MKLYKIRKKNTDLFSTGGSSPHWTTKGKAWTSLGHVKCHMGQTAASYADAEIVEYTVTETAVQDAAAVMEQIKAAHAAKDAKRLASHRKWIEDGERQELLRLQQKYPNGPKPW